MHAGDTITLRAPTLASNSQLSRPYRPNWPLASVGCDAVPSSPRDEPPAQLPSPLPHSPSPPKTLDHVPDGQNATGLSEVGLILNTADPLLEDGRDLGWRCLRVGVCADGGDGGCGISLQRGGLALARDPRGAKTRSKIRAAPDKLPRATHRRCDGGKSSIDLRRGAPGAIDGVCGRRWAEGRQAGSDVRRWTHYGDSARGREGADDARALAEGVPEHLVMVSEGGCNWRETIATSCNCVEGRLRRRLMKV